MGEIYHHDFEALGSISGGDGTLTEPKFKRAGWVMNVVGDQLEFYVRSGCVTREQDDDDDDESTLEFKIGMTFKFKLISGPMVKFNLFELKEFDARREECSLAALACKLTQEPELSPLKERYRIKRIMSNMRLYKNESFTLTTPISRWRRSVRDMSYNTGARGYLITLELNTATNLMSLELNGNIQYKLVPSKEGCANPSDEDTIDIDTSDRYDARVRKVVRDREIKRRQHGKSVC